MALCRRLLYHQSSIHRCHTFLPLFSSSTRSLYPNHTRYTNSDYHHHFSNQNGVISYHSPDTNNSNDDDDRVDLHQTNLINYNRYYPIKQRNMEHFLLTNRYNIHHHHPHRPHYQYQSHRHYNNINLWNKHLFDHKYQLHHHHRYPFSSDPKLSKLDRDKSSKPVKESKETKETAKTWTKYLNPVFILSKTGSILYNIVYYTIDSIIHPSRGYERLQNLWKKIKKEAKHFWEGSKLMWTDIKTAIKILRKLPKGGELTYREKRQLRRVALDILRFVPMLIIILIPFLEALLPVILILFPNMLPSRFQSEHMKLERRKKLLAARIGLASFFEDTLHEFVKETKRKEESISKVESLEKLLDKIKYNEEISNDQILKLASLFDDEMALDNASANVLSNMCRYMQLNTFGTEAMLRKRLYDKIRSIRKEDAGIRKEGLDNIPESLLKQLLRERGMRSDFQEWVLRANMQRWLELSLDNDVPVTLLIMSRIFTLQHIPGHDAADMLKDTISTIGEATTKEMLVEKGGIDDPKLEKEIIERQQQLIAEEAALQKEIDEETKKEKEKPTELKMEDGVVEGGEIKEEKIEKKRIKNLAESVETMTTESAVDHEKQELKEIKEKLQEIQDETDALWEELKEKKHLEELEKLDVMEKVIEKEEEFVNIIDQQEGDMMDEERKEREIKEEFDIKEEQIDFVDVEQEIEDRKKIRNKLSKRIDKFIEKSAIYADETGNKFANTLKRFNDNAYDITEDELKNALKDTLIESSKFTDKEIEEFLKELDVRKEKEPHIKLSKRIEKLIDDYDEGDIDLKDIKHSGDESDQSRS